MLKALIIEDDRLLAAKLKRVISEKFDSDVCYDGISGVNYIDNNTYDLIIADSILPKKSGIDIIDYVRDNGLDTPILIVTIAESFDEKSRIMKHKITEYLPRTAEKTLLNSTIDTLLQRGSNVNVENKVTYNDLVLDLTNEIITSNQGTINTIKGKYLELLSFFVINNNIVLEKEEIFDRVWGIDSETTINAIEVYISGLRKELKKIGYDKNLKTVRGVGYTFE